MAVRFTEYVPGAYQWIGFCSVEIKPSPKFQNQEVVELDEASLNWTASGDVPDVTFAVKSATGSGGTIRVIICSFVSLPFILVTVSFTV